jgi:3-oxoacyl-[acyl-carrier protein] reductase
MDKRTSTEPPVAVVTGCNRGTGLAIAERLHQAGMRVWGLNRTPVPDVPFAQVTCDLADLVAVERAVHRVVAEEGRLDVVVANAVDRYYAPIADLDLDRWSRALTVNLTSVVALVKAALPALRAVRGQVVLMGSHAGVRFFEGGVSYCAAKAAFRALSETLLLEERANGVRTSLVNPGAIANELGDDSPLKMSTASVAEVVAWVLTAPADLTVGEVETRPSRLEAPIIGIDRLQAV